jgi:hypothetical protein
MACRILLADMGRARAAGDLSHANTGIDLVLPNWRSGACKSVMMFPITRAALTSVQFFISTQTRHHQDGQ